VKTANAATFARQQARKNIGFAINFQQVNPSIETTGSEDNEQAPHQPKTLTLGR
jgi:hypothetical protein